MPARGKKPTWAGPSHYRDYAPNPGGVSSGVSSFCDSVLFAAARCIRPTAKPLRLRDNAFWCASVHEGPRRLRVSCSLWANRVKTPTRSPSACQCRGCGRYPSRMRPAYQRDTPIMAAIFDVPAAYKYGVHLASPLKTANSPTQYYLRSYQKSTPQRSRRDHTQAGRVSHRKPTEK